MWRVLSKYLLRIWAAIGVISTIIGFAGMSDDLEKWSGWANDMAHDPWAVAFAERAVAVAEFVNQGWVRAALIIVGISLIIWPAHWFWKLRHGAFFWWRRQLSEPVWISREVALTRMAESDWGIIKSPTITQTVSIFDSLSGFGSREKTVSGTPEATKKKIMFRRYLSDTLNKFCSDNQKSCRNIDGKQEIDEVALMTFLERAINSEVHVEFGDIPDTRL